MSGYTEGPRCLLFYDLAYRQEVTVHVQPFSCCVLHAHSAGHPFLDLHYGDRQSARDETVRFLQATANGSHFVTRDP